MPSDCYEIHAVRYARLDRRSSDNFLGGDPHDYSMPLDYYVWAIVGEERTFIVDTGFDAKVGARRKREMLTPVSEGLATIGIRHAEVTDVIVTHLHYDHAGNTDLFPNAKFHIQDGEMAFATGRCMCHGLIAGNFEEDDVVAMVRRNFRGQLVFHDGDTELAPGITLHKLCGHSAALQVVRVKTSHGHVVLASDAAHHYAHIEHSRAFPALLDLPQLLEGYSTLKRLATSPDHIVPGHDPLVIERYPSSRTGLEGIV
jgi:glyoxylase-like metal-dependent hydrolase (beta-lactamase superfamily II)